MTTQEKKEKIQALVIEMLEDGYDEKIPNSLEGADLSLAKLDDETLAIADLKNSKINVLPLVPKESWDLLQKHYGTSNVIETENSSFEERDVASE